MTEFEENRRIRIVSDSHGTVLDSVFTVAEREGETEFTLDMEARPHKLFPRPMVPLLRGMVAKALKADMDAVKVHCEKQEKGQAQGSASPDGGV